MKTTMKLLALALALVLAFTCTACVDPQRSAHSSGNNPSTNPTSTDPTSTDPTSSDPTSTDPTSSDPTSSDPTSTDPAPTNPAPTEPTPSQPRPNGVACTDIVLSSTIIEFTDGGRSQLLSVNLTPSNTTDKVTFVSLNPAVVTVTDGGLVTPVGNGDTVIRVTCGSVTKECRVICSFGNADTEPTPTDPAPTEPAANEFVNLNNYTYDSNTLSIKPRHVYWQDGNLVAECFVINGFSHTVYDIEVKSLSFANPDGLIAAGGFGSLQNLVLGPYQYAVWTFTFSPDCISAAGADLSTLQCNASSSYRH